MPDEQDTPTPEPTPEDALPEQEHDGSSEPETEAGADAVEPQDAVEEEHTNSEAEAAALAAAMAAINQVQGVADSAVSTKPQAPSSGGGGDAQPFSAPEFQTSAPVNAKGEIDLLSDVHMDVRIELGRTRMFVEDVLKLSDGAVVELDKLAGDPVDVFVNNRRVARGEVLVLNDLFCVRINEVVDIAESED